MSTRATPGTCTAMQEEISKHNASEDRTCPSAAAHGRELALVEHHAGELQPAVMDPEFLGKDTRPAVPYLPLQCTADARVRHAM